MYEEKQGINVTRRRKKKCVNEMKKKICFEAILSDPARGIKGRFQVLDYIKAISGPAKNNTKATAARRVLYIISSFYLFFFF